MTRKTYCGNLPWPRVLCFVAFMADCAFLLMASRHVARSRIPWLILLCLALPVFSGAGFMAAGVKSLRLRNLLHWSSAVPGVFMVGCFLSTEWFPNMTCGVLLSKVFWVMLFWIPFLASVRGVSVRFPSMVGLYFTATVPLVGLLLLAFFKNA